MGLVDVIILVAFIEGKKQPLKTFEAIASLIEYVRVFKSIDSTVNEIEKAGER